MEGRISIEEEINRKINSFLASKHALRLGISVQIVVKTGTGRWLYPSFDQGYTNILDSDSYPKEGTERSTADILKIAEKNWKIMQEGLRFGLTVKIPAETLLANSILAFYIIIFTFLLYRTYRKSAREAQLIEISNKQALKTANEKLIAAQQKLQDIAVREKGYQHEISSLKTELDLVSDRVRETEDDALTEIERLEKKLQESVSIKEYLELEVAHLKGELERIEFSQKAPERKQKKQVNGAMKRFKTLYKNLEIQQRAIEGFMDLESDLQLRAEELIHKMNLDCSKLPVKRKIFSKKGAAPAFECEFGYRGRVYWRPGQGTKTEILVIGTKNTQTRDLTYLENL